MSADAVWLRLADEAALATPALVLFPERIEENLRRMIALAGDPARLRPHVKTHKLPALVALQVRLGITRCKCATIAEAEMAAGAGAAEVTLAAQPTGPNTMRLVELARAFPAVRFSTVVDDGSALAGLTAAVAGGRASLEVLVDLDVGMARTGIVPGPAALELYAAIAAAPGQRPGGLHAYDGHLRQRSLEERIAAAAPAVARVDALRAELIARGFPVPRVVWGGTPTFPVHARRAGIELSPGTCVLWDAGYRDGLPDLDFLPAAALLTRVISRPGTGRLCLDLGHKAVASEMPHPRVVFPELPDARAVTHSEEHLVVETARAADFPVGTVLHGIPWHICPTVALHDRALVARGGRVVESWPVLARARRLNF
jgi:D-serine deaminase-like pyridoxal phosphate-dependent protein